MQAVQLQEGTHLGYYTFYKPPGGDRPEVFWLSTELALRDHRVAYVIPHERWRHLCSDRPCRLLVPTAAALRFGRPLTPRSVVVLEDEHEVTDEVTGACEVRVMRWWYICVVVLSAGAGDDGSPAYGGSWLWELSHGEVEELTAAMEADPEYTGSPLLAKDLLAPTKPLEFDVLELNDYVERVEDFSEHPNKQRIYATMMFPMVGPLGDGIRETESAQIGTGVHHNFSVARRAWLAERPRTSSRRQRTDRQQARTSASQVLELHRASLRARIHASFDDVMLDDLRRYLWTSLASHLADRHTAPLPADAARSQLLSMRLVCKEADAAVREVGAAATMRLTRSWMRSWEEGAGTFYCAWFRFFCTWYGLSPLDVERQLTNAVLKGKGCGRFQFDEQNTDRTRWVLFLRLLWNVPLNCAPPAVVRSLRARPPSRKKRCVTLRLKRP